jgi:hypothetical protein
MEPESEGATAVPCPDCGAEEVGGREGCHRLFEDLMAREEPRHRELGAGRG